MSSGSTNLETPRRQALLLVPLVLGAVLSKLSDSTVVSSIVLLLEPILWMGAIHIALWLFFSKRTRLGLAFILSSATGIVLVHTPLGTVQRTGESIPFETLPDPAQCSPATRTSSVPIRVLQWTLDPTEDMELDAVQLSRLQPDIVLLHGLTKSDLAEQIAENLEGEALHIASADGAFTSVIIRGQFETCGTGQKYWTTQSNTEGVELVLAMPNLAEAGPTPVLVVEVDTPSGPSDIRHWHDRVGTAQHGVQSLTQSISTSNLVVVGDFAAPRSFRSLQSTLSGAGLIEAEVPASWPAGGGIFPLPGLHAFDRLWTGPAWSHQQSRRVRVLTQSRSLLVSDLMPDEVVQP